jgi:uncharacterized protein (TIGR02217 family)
VAFHDIQFPPEISYGAQGGPEFSTSVITVKSGQESRNQNWSESRIRWDVSTAIKNQTDLEELIAFFRARKGRAHAFRFKDWSDYTATTQIIGTGNGVATTFQLSKTYDDTLIQTTRVITRPVANTTRIFLNNVEQLSGWTVNTTTGIVTFTSPVGNTVVVKASFQFDIPARFDTDSLRINIQNFNGYVGESINIVEIRE